jgi:hypothetical protein
MSTQTFGALSARNPVHNAEGNLLQRRCLLIGMIDYSTFCTETCTAVLIREKVEKNQKIVLTAEAYQRILLIADKQ